MREPNPYSGDHAGERKNAFADAFFDRCAELNLSEEKVSQMIEKVAASYGEGIAQQLKESMTKRAGRVDALLGLGGKALSWGGRMFGRAAPAAENVASRAAPAVTSTVSRAAPAVSRAATATGAANVPMNIASRTSHLPPNPVAALPRPIPTGPPPLPAAGMMPRTGMARLALEFWDESGKVQAALGEVQAALLLTPAARSSAA